MKHSHLFIAHTIAFLLFAFLLLVSPQTLADFYEVELTAASAYFGRIVAVAYIALATCAWLIRNEGPSPARTAFVLSLFVFNVAISLVMGEAALQKIAGPMSWGGVVLGLILGTACLYLLMTGRRGRKI